MTIEEAQEECKRRFPIGCRYKSTAGVIYTLKQDLVTYRIARDDIYAHEQGGCLYDNGVFAELISLPKGYKVPKQPKPKKDDLKPLVKLLKEIL